MPDNNKQRHSEAMQATQRFIEQDKPSEDVLRLCNALELAYAKLQEIAGPHISQGTERHYHRFMKSLSDDNAAFIRHRMKAAAKPFLN